MSYRPRIGGKLRKETSGADKSQATCSWWGADPVGQTFGLNVVLTRLASADRSAVTGAKSVCFAWICPARIEERGKDISESIASQPFYLLHPARKTGGHICRTGVPGISSLRDTRTG
jgi:hypothetical protein